MPELPDVTVYVACLHERIASRPLECARVVSPFLLRSVEPPIEVIEGKTVRGVRRIGKRIVIELDDDLFLVFHLMIAGRFLWRKRGAKPPGKIGLAAFDFPDGTLILTEASKKKRAALHVVRGADALAAHDPGGLEVLTADLAEFVEAVRRENHTLKRTLTDPRLLAGIGNAYSDEILYAAGLSPVKHTSRLTDAEIEQLFAATRDTLTHWTDTLREEFKSKFPGPGDITAFREGFAVHGRYSRPCPECGVAVQRIRYAESETNYCPQCQTGGKILADRSLSRLLKDDWPRTIDALEGP